MKLAKLDGSPTGFCGSGAFSPRVCSGSLLVMIFRSYQILKENTVDLQNIRQEIAAEIQKLMQVYKALGGVTTNGHAKPRRKMSKAAREKIAAAQRKRWAKQRKAA